MSPDSTHTHTHRLLAFIVARDNARYRALGCTSAARLRFLSSWPLSRLPPIHHPSPANRSLLPRSKSSTSRPSITYHAINNNNNNNITQTHTYTHYQLLSSARETSAPSPRRLVLTLAQARQRSGLTGQRYLTYCAPHRHL